MSGSLLEQFTEVLAEHQTSPTAWNDREGAHVGWKCSCGAKGARDMNAKTSKDALAVEAVVRHQARVHVAEKLTDAVMAWLDGDDGAWQLDVREIRKESTDVPD